MTTNSNITLTSLDFDTNKQALKDFLRSQNRFSDYDFDGANINVLLDVLSYTTFNNSFYLSQVANEMFLDTAELRDSVVSHAKELNYTPRSFKSAEAKIQLTVLVADTTQRTLIIPKGFTFSSRMLNRTFTFSTNENIILEDYQVQPGGLLFTSPEITLGEGYYVTDNFTFANTTSQRFIISNANVDTSTLSVTVVEDQGTTIRPYTRAQSLFDIDSTSEIFFVQGAENETYEIVFGDGVSGRKPNLRSAIIVEYRISNGQLPNGCLEFVPDGPIGGSTNIVVTTLAAAAGGDVSETIESIRYNAPRHFAAQERAVTPEDYESLLKIQFPEINAVSAYGGETLTPPQYGKVFVAVDLKEVDGLPDSKRIQFFNYLRARTTMTPVFVEPLYTYIGVNTTVKYNINTTSLTADDIRMIVKSAIGEFAQRNLNNFNRTFRLSQFVSVIDDSQQSIISNETDIVLIKKLVPGIGTSTFDVDFDTPLMVRFKPTGSYAVYSSTIIYNGSRATIRDNGQGQLNVYSTSGESELANVGTIQYDTGLLQLSAIKIDNYEGSSLRFYALPEDKDISVTNNVILNIVDEDIVVQVEGQRG